MLPEKKILFAVLDWGLGHASRSTPVIRALLSHGCTVVLASSGRAALWLRQEFTDLKLVELPDYGISYRGGVLLAMARQTFSLFDAIAHEHRAFSAIALAERPDLIISDNRYGCYINGIPSVFIGHQLNFTIPMIGWIVTAIHKRMIRHFDELAVPDTPERALSGILSKVSGVKLRFIGPLSRFVRPIGETAGRKWHFVALVSGPDPDATRFFKRLLPMLRATGKPCLILAGNPDVESAVDGKVVIRGKMASAEICQALLAADIVVSRSGYSSLMDYAALGVKAIIVPTPGQPEQEYLARRAASEGFAVAQREYELDLDTAIRELPVVHGFPFRRDDGWLQSAISHWLLITAS